MMKYRLRYTAVCSSCINAGYNRKVGDYLLGSLFLNANAAYSRAAEYNQDPHPTVPRCKCKVEVVEIEE